MKPLRFLKFLKHILILLGLSFLPSLPVQADLLGDVTGDGQVRLEDVVRVLKVAVGLQKFNTFREAFLADVAPRPGTGGRKIGDGKINLLDVIQLLRFVAGLISPKDFGMEEVLLALDPTIAVLGPGEQVQFTAVVAGPVQGSIRWSLGPGSVGTLTSTGLYIAPQEVRDFASAVVFAEIDNLSVKADVFIEEAGPPPPPPIPPG